MAIYKNIRSDYSYGSVKVAHLAILTATDL